MNKFILTILTFSLFSLQVSAQDSVRVDPSLRGQYQLMLSKSKSLNGYKLINPSRLSAFYRSVSDTLRIQRNQLKAAQGKITTQEKSIAVLNQEIEGKESSLATSNSKLDQISFIGIPFSKSTYNTIVWSLIVILALSFAFVTVRSAKNIQEAKYRSGLYEEISQDYQAYKVKANEKEKKLARELQDERNKLEELRSRGI
jgi:hypothetical protein